MTSKTFALLALTLAASGGAFAQTVINHSKALAGNVTPGDAAGYPITISKPGHYVLKSNLTVPDGTSGVVIATEGVTLDLNGFTIGGGRTCSQNGSTRVVTCSAGGGGYGVDSSTHAATVRNGNVSGLAIGVWIDGGLVEKVNAYHNQVGMLASNVKPTHLTGVLVAFSSEAGIRFDAFGMVDNVAVSNNTVGIECNSTLPAVRDSAVYANATGIEKCSMRETQVIGNNTNTNGTVQY